MTAELRDSGRPPEAGFVPRTTDSATAIPELVYERSVGVTLSSRRVPA